MICLIAAFAHAKHDHFLHATEAKAKDTKKSKAKDSLFGGQALSRPRTGMLEAKAKAKDTAESVLRKKGLQKSFSGNFQFIGIARIFDWGA